MTELHDLLVLQQRDTILDQLRHRRATLPERALVAGLTTELRRVTADLAAGQIERDGLGTTQARLEADVAVSEEKRHTLERRLSSTSVPREAQTMSAEIDGLKARQSSIEDDIMEIMEALEPLDARLSAGAIERASLEERLAAATASLATSESAVDGEITAARSARDTAAVPIPASLLERYERLRVALDGIAVATLDVPRCTGCNLTLPVAELERVRLAGPDSVIECEQCGRILVR